MDPNAAEYNVHEAKTHFSKLLDRVEKGDEIVINRAGRPVARVVPLRPEGDRRRTFGIFADSLVVQDDWDSDETNAALADDWYR